MDELSTDTIDLRHLDLDQVTESGSFPVHGVSSSSIGRLFDTLPTPVILIDRSLTIVMANSACEKIAASAKQLQGVSFNRVFGNRTETQRMRDLLLKVFETRKPMVTEGTIRVSKGSMWGRMHLRSLRVAGEQLILVVVEDLTLARRQIVLQAKHQRELRTAQADLERRVAERTAELSRTNRSLRREISQREKAENRMAASIRLLEKTVRGTVEALASMAEKRDPYTAGHQRRVAILASRIAKEMGLPQEHVSGIQLAAAMHDIGKIGVPAELLSKPGAINEHEFAIIRAHPEVGHEILKMIEFPWPLADIVLQHHERINGSGYPRGMKGGDILVESKIIAVADVVEAMSSHRPYRPAVGAAEGLAEIKLNRGLLYDSRTVDACQKVFENGFSFV